MTIDEIKRLRASEYGVAALRPDHVDWLIAEVDRLRIANAVQIARQFNFSEVTPAEAKVADALVQDAWTFVYEPETNFVGAYHTRGGKQSICEITNPIYRYELGVRIAELLNAYGIGNGAMLAAKAKDG